MGALTAMILFLMIIVVVLVVCKARIFVRKTPKVLETLPSSNENKESTRCRDENYTEDQGKINHQYTEDSHASSIKSVLPNRSPRVQDRKEKIRAMPSKEIENV